MIAKAELMLRHIVKLDLEDPVVVRSLLNLFLGQADAKSQHADDKRAPASVPLKIKIMGYLNRSVTACNSMALTLKVVTNACAGQICSVVWLMRLTSTIPRVIELPSFYHTSHTIPCHFSLTRFEMEHILR